MSQIERLGIVTDSARAWLSGITAIGFMTVALTVIGGGIFAGANLMDVFQEGMGVAPGEDRNAVDFLGAVGGFFLGLWATKKLVDHIRPAVREAGL